jgi:hypothetical protein
MIPGVDPHNHDISYHRKLGKYLSKNIMDKPLLTKILTIGDIIQEHFCVFILEQ